MKKEQAMTQKDNCGECDLGFNPHQEHYRQVNLPSVLSSPNGEGNGINSITNLSPYRPNALTPLAKTAFTMAEILLSLTIIGVVAAITLPSLTGNINERTWNTQRKALYSRMSQAVALMPALNGYGIGATEEETKINAAETFLSAGLSKVFKINNICDSEHLQDCGLPNKIIALNGEVAFEELPKTLVAFNNMFSGSFDEESTGGHWEYSQNDTNAAGFESANGESVLVYYNPKCKPWMNETLVAKGEPRYFYTQPKMCANFVYDLNGKKGPNSVGKDIGFITALYSSDSVVVAPMPLKKFTVGYVKFNVINSACAKADAESRMPNLNEAISMFYNKNLVKTEADRMWSSSIVSTGSNGRSWGIHFDSGQAYAYGVTAGMKIHCIKR